MKIAILNDTHCGVRSDMVEMSNYQGRFYDEVFFPYLDEHNIKQIVHLGDYFDRRKFINFASLKANKQHFIDPMIKRGIQMDLILGNHDTYYKNTNEVNAIKELCTTFDGIKEPWIYEKATTINFGGTDICLIPWICDDNKKEIKIFFI